MNIFKKAIKEVKKMDTALTECKTPKFRKPTPPPKPNPNYTSPPSVKKSCHYITPCGWCAKWDKKCDKKIGCSGDNKPQRGLRAKAGIFLEDAMDPGLILEKI